MGLPSYLKKQYSEYIKDEGPRNNLIYRAGARSWYLEQDARFCCAIQAGMVEFTALMKFAYKEKFFPKRLYRKPRDYKGEGPSFEKEKIYWFVGLIDKEDGLYSVTKEFKVSSWFHGKAMKISGEREEKALRKYNLEMEIDRIRNTEQGRTFKGRLRQIIMERDGYKCVLCGKSAEDGVKLEVDHIKAWEDGGRTIYDNGRTVCSDCNKGLHWAKKFKEKLEEVQEVTA